jgi:hypothetical protein
MQKKNYLMAFTAAFILLAVCIGPAAAYSNYEYIWSSSGNQLVEESSITSGYASNAEHWGIYYQYDTQASKYSYLVTPFVNSINKNGVHPKVRYLWFALEMPVGVSATSVYVYNGPTVVYSHSLTWAGTGAYKEYMLDMGSYKDMNRGINTELQFYSPGSPATIYTYGAGAKEEW